MYSAGQMTRMYDVYLIIRDVNSEDVGEYTLQVDVGSGTMMTETLMLTSRFICTLSFWKCNAQLDMSSHKLYQLFAFETMSLRPSQANMPQGFYMTVLL